MSNLDLENLVAVLDNNGQSLIKEQKRVLGDLLKRALGVKDKQTIGEVVNALKEEIKNTLKTDLIEEVKAELTDEIREKVNKLEQIEKEKTQLQTQLQQSQNEILKGSEQTAEQIHQLEGKLDAANTEKQDLETAKEQVEEALKTKTQELKEAEEKQQELQEQLTNEQQTFDTVIEGLFADGSIKTEIEGLINLTGEKLKDEVKDLYNKKLRSEIEVIIGSNLSKTQDENEFHQLFQTKLTLLIENKSTDEIAEAIKEELKNNIINVSQFRKEFANLKQLLKDKEDKIKELEAKQNTQEVEGLQQKLTAKENEITQLKQQPNAKDEQIKTLQNEVQQLKEENKELEAKNKTPEQPKQGNGAKYTATIGMGLAAGLVAFTALERTVRLEMLVMIGIAVTSALVVGGITYAVLPSTQVDQTGRQNVKSANRGA